MELGSPRHATVGAKDSQLSGQIGDLVSQAMAAQTRGDNASRDDIVNAIMASSRNQSWSPGFGNTLATSLFPPQMGGGSGGPPFGSPLPSPVPKKVETRDSPAQVDIPDVMAANQRGTKTI